MKDWINRISQIVDGTDSDYIKKTGKLLLQALQLAEDVSDEAFFKRPLEDLQALWQELYRPMLPEHYEHDFLYPPFAKKLLGEELGALLSALYADLYASISYALQQDTKKLALLAEFFVQSCVECRAEETEGARARNVRRTMAAFYHDNARAFVEPGVRAMVVPDETDVCHRILDEQCDLNDLRYLYRYGCHIGKNELEMAAYLNGLSDEEIHKIAATYVGGYIKGFAVTGKDITKKKTVKVEYPVGFERVVREAVRLFAKEGLSATFVPEAVLSFTGRGNGKRGVYTSSPNRRFDFDHKDDKGLYQSAELNQRKLAVLEECFRQNETAAREHGGPAVIEVFGEASFEPMPESKNYTYTAEQNRENVAYAAKSGELTNRFIPGEERSFTIIAFPLPEIGGQFEEIFREIIKVNTLDYELYRDIQQRIIDALDRGTAVRVRGAGDNVTDMLVRLHGLTDPGKQTNFENCVADVNIPVGEVFTSPRLEGTAGTLFVSHAYLGEYEYKNLRLEFADGMVTDYSCDNFKDSAQGRRFIEDNVLYHHPTLPVGEFAIGTNTTAYRLARDYRIEGKLPILIMEKTGPHFAVGDTCYSHAEDVPMFNPDGKECIARDNSRSLLRKSEDEEKKAEAYFHCHTDITIPFDELQCITVLEADGKETDIIRDGRFVLPGTEELNVPLQ